MTFIRLLFVGITSGLLFSFMDGLFNQNNLARALYEYYKAIARPGINPYIVIGVFVFYGTIMAFLYEFMHKALPGKSGIAKGTIFGLIAWFYKVVMYAITQWILIPVPVMTICYIAATGLVEMLVLGWFYGIFLQPEERRSVL